MTSRLSMLALAGLLIGAGAAVFILGRDGLNLGPSSGTVTTGKALIGGPFSLTDHTGKRVTEKDFLGRYTLVFFGFTHCPDICPSALQVIAAALAKMGDKGKAVTPVFVTLDPERDSPEKLASYIQSFDKTFIGLTGSKDEVAAAAKAYRIYYEVIPDAKNAGEYTIDHAAIIYLMGKDGQFVTHIPHTTNVDQVVDVLNKAID